MISFPRIFRSFDEFERDELRKLDSLHTTVEDMLEERFTDEMDLVDALEGPARRRREMLD